MSETRHRWEGQVVAGRFELRAYLGRSEYGHVFATDHNGQLAAIKLIEAEGKQLADYLLRWEQTVSLSHPNLVQLFDTGRCRIGDSDWAYVVMERADEALVEILPQRALTPSEASEMLPAILEALAYLHGHGFAHGSVKPANILAFGDRVKISSDAICPVGALACRPSAYDAPEVRSNANRTVSPETDVWSLGMTLAEALTQQLPRWPDSNLSNPIFSEPLCEPFLDIVANCLTRDPQRRWTARDILARLRPSPHFAQPRGMPPETSSDSLPLRTTVDWRHMAPGIVLIVLAVMIIFAAPKIRDRLEKRHAEAALPEMVATPGKRPTALSPDAPHTAGTPKPTNPSAQDVSARKEPNRSPTAPPQEATTSAAPSRRAETAADEVADRVVPQVPQKARDTIRGTVRVAIRVEVGPSGEVSAVSIESPGPSRYFADLAIGAAREWKFAPAPADGGSPRRTWILQFEFTQTTTKVFPAPVGRHP
jgi:TonB family protein